MLVRLYGMSENTYDYNTITGETNDTFKRKKSDSEISDNSKNTKCSKTSTETKKGYIIAKFLNTASLFWSEKLCTFK